MRSVDACAICGCLYAAMNWWCCRRLGLSRLYKALYILIVHLFLHAWFPPFRTLLQYCITIRPTGPINDNREDGLRGLGFEWTHHWIYYTTIEWLTC
jgi:hypothetical protein